MVRKVGRPGGLDLLVALRLLRDQSEGQVRQVLEEAIAEIERLRAAVDGGSGEDGTERTRAGRRS
jgi:hypothetical protein